MQRRLLPLIHHHETTPAKLRWQGAPKSIDDDLSAVRPTRSCHISFLLSALILLGVWICHWGHADCPVGQAGDQPIRDLMHIIDCPKYQAFAGSRRAKIFSIAIYASAIAASSPAFGGSVRGAVTDSSETITYDIPAQSLEGALDAYGNASRMHVLYESALTAGLQSMAVEGSFTADDALRRLLAGTNLTMRYTGPKSYTLVPLSQDEAGAAASPSAKVANLTPPRQQILDFPHFLGGIQAGITERLCGDPLTRPGSYKIALQFWVNSAGAIQSPRVLKSSGDNARDAAVTDALRTLHFSEAAPADMPQPITMVVAPHMTGGDCP